jgi:hypothetical protein
MSGVEVIAELTLATHLDELCAKLGNQGIRLSIGLCVLRHCLQQSLQCRHFGTAINAC